LEIVVQLMVDILYFIVFALDVVDFRTGLWNLRFKSVGFLLLRLQLLD
jgi:hypothetical protein